MTKTTQGGFQPGPFAGLEIESLEIASWCPTPDASGPATQVHMTIRLKGIDLPLIMRFKGPATLGLLIDKLTEYRREVWPNV